MRYLKQIIMAASLAVAVSCAFEEPGSVIPEPSGETVIFKAMLAEDETRTVIGTNENGRPQTMWTAGDRITIHNGSKGFEFTTDITETSASADFTYVGDDFSAENGVIAVSPACEAAADLANKTVIVNIPADQKATEGSFDPAAGVAVAYSTDDLLRFKNTTALLKFSVATENVRSVVFKGNSDELVCGNVLAAFKEDGSILESVVPQSDSNAGMQVALTAEDTFQVGEIYYLAIAPQTFENGFSISFRFDDGGSLFTVLDYEEARTIGRNVILNCGTLEFDIYSGLSTTETPRVDKFRFNVDDNPGKILPGQVASGTEYKANARSAEECNVSGNRISAMIPYLNNRNLVPYFEIPDGTRMIYDGRIVEKGVTMIDFTKCRELKVINGNKDEAVYTVELTNTGLPVVVVNQVSGTTKTSIPEGMEGGYAEWLRVTGTSWQPKESDWEMADDGSDNFMAYYADGTPAVVDKNGIVVEGPVMASTRVRGNVSQMMPKKPFAVKLDSKSGVLGMPAHKRWVLLANWSDRTLMRNAIAFETAKYFKDNLSDGLLWNPSGQFVELVYNGVHVGNYYLCEQIKIDKNRLNITEPYDAKKAYSGSATDYGYLLECDDAYDEKLQFTTRHYIPFMFKDDGNQEMLDYAQGLVCDIEDALCTGSYSSVYQTLDLTSMVDYLLINEVMMNGEIWNPKSVYMYIDKGKLYAGPIWDFDWQTIPNISVIESNFDNPYTNNYGKSSYDFTFDSSMINAATPKSSWLSKTYYLYHSSSYPSAPLDGNDRNFIWYPMLVKDGTFTAKAKERWTSVSGDLLSHITQFIDDMAGLIETSEEINWSMWEFEANAKSRHSSYNIGGGFKGDELAKDFNEAVELLKTNYTNRVNGMNGFVNNQSWPDLSYQNK